AIRILPEQVQAIRLCLADDIVRVFIGFAVAAFSAARLRQGSNRGKHQDGSEQGPLGKNHQRTALARKYSIPTTVPQRGAGGKPCAPAGSRRSGRWRKRRRRPA